MKNLILFVIISVSLVTFSCKEKDSERFELLTGTIWEAESLLADGVDATGPDGLLADFVGEALFKADGTGTFGNFVGEWKFNSDETKITISSDDLLLPITCDIIELTGTTLKLETLVPNPEDLQTPITVEMTFRAK